MPNEDYFSCKCDRAIIGAGGFYCQACLMGRPAGEQSPDPRYCQRCYEFLLEEASLLHPTKRPKWIPKTEVIGIPQQCSNAFLDAENNKPMEIHTDKQKEVLLHTKDVTSHAYQNPTLGRPKTNIGGRPKKDVPVELIHKLSEEGLSIGRIVKELKRQGQSISAMTISRVLTGERRQDTQLAKSG